MEFTVYRQSTKERPTGEIIYKGEDALPYVGKNLLMVADGMGGAAAIRHQKFNPEMFDQEKLLDVLFHDVFEYYGDEEFREYVLKSFYEFLSIKDCYFDNINNIKKGGYFASRLVSAIMLYEILIYEKKEFEDGKIFEQFNSKDEAERTEMATELGKYFRDQIQSKLQQIAKNANLIYESSYSGLALLGTTLCATIFHEQDDVVEAFYLVAGDSRPYMWNESGLYQVMDDQEGADGGMTNYIKANEGESFDVVCEYKKFSKPCILFNATDGCFDSKYFPSQMAFEKLILDSIIASDSIDDAGKKVEETFLEYGKHDDSSTIALKVFGYTEYDQLKEAARKRLAYLNDTYFAKLSDLLERDYVAEYQEVERELPAKMSGICTKLNTSNSVLSYCRSQIAAGDCPEYNKKNQEIEENISACDKTINASDEFIHGMIERYYLIFERCLYAAEDKFPDRRPLEKASATRNDYEEAVGQYRNIIVSFQNLITAESEVITRSLTTADSLNSPWNYASIDSIDYSEIARLKKEYVNLFHFFESLESQRNEFIKRITQLRAEFYKKNQKKAKDNAETVDKIFKLLLSGEIDFHALAMFPHDERDLNARLSSIKEWAAKRDQLSTIDRAEAMEHVLPGYIEAHCVDIATLVESGKIVLEDDTAKQEIIESLTAIKKTKDELKHGAEEQQKLFEQYDKVYYSLIRRNEQ